MTPKEALNNLIHHIYSEGSMDVNERENYRHIIQKSFDELEVLKKRNEPKKVVFNEKDTTYVGCADCPSCGSTIDKEILTGVTNFCPHCGQAMDWGETK